MAAVLKLCVLLICLGLVESLVGDCPCDECKIMKRVTVKKPIYTSTTCRQRYTTRCGWWRFESCTRYRTGYERTITGYAIGYEDRFVSCRPSCRCQLV